MCLVPARVLCSALLWLALCLVPAEPRGQSFSLFHTNAAWRYAKGTAEASLPDRAAWRQPSYSDAAWSSGAAPFFYGESYLAPGTLLSDMQNRYTTLFLRRSFVITNASAIEMLELTAACDDGFLASINGSPVVSANAPEGEPFHDATAPAAATEPVPFLGYPLADPSGFLVAGTNVLAVQVFNVSAGSSDLVFDAALTATLKESTDPRVVTVTPSSESALAHLTEITVTFSRAVTGVDAGDLWLNETPSTAVHGSGTTYTFSFPQPAWGTVQVSWDMRHGITGLGQPPTAFNATGPGARWLYELYEPGAPKLAALNPPAEATVRQLSQIEVWFDRPVQGVDSADLLIDGVPTSNVAGAAAGPYVFAFAPRAAGLASIAWVAACGIVDLTPEARPFEGGSWSYAVDPELAVPDVIINEFVAENVSGLKDEEGDCEDWIELYNRGNTPVNLDGWSLTDDAGRPGQWVFPAVSLPARRFLVVFASGKDRRPTAAGATLHTNFKLGLAGEYIGLYNGESPRLAVDEIAPEYPEQRNGVAYGRDTLGAWRYCAAATPGQANSPSWINGVVEPVHFSVPRGFFARPFSLSLATPTPGAAIRYTLDGSVPSLTNGILYTNVIGIGTTRVIRAAAFRADRLPSRVTTHTYLYNQSAMRRTLPALSLVTASNHLYGKTGIMEYNPRNTLNHGIAWERPVSVEWLAPEDNGGFQIDCGLRIQGGGYIRNLYNYRSGSIPESKYSFRLYFRGDYGEGRLRQPLFSEVPVDSFDTLVLRAGMNDATNPFLRDEFARRLESDVGQVSARGTFVNLFLNGVYKGYYNPTERIDDDFLQTWHGGTNRWDIIAMGGEVREGDAIAWNAMRAYASANNLALAPQYLEIERRLDTTNFVEYLIPLIYGDTDDWPHNNWRAARERTGGAPFRFYAWDAEWSFGYNNEPTHNTIAGQLSNLSPPWGGTEIQTLFLRLKASPEFRLLFADRVHRHFFNAGAMTDERLKARYEWLKSMIAPAISGFNNAIGTSWIPSRRRYLTNHFALAGLLASSNAPVFSQFGGPVMRGYRLSLASGVGTIYYTTNETDPRVRFTGAVAADAIAYSPGTPIVVDRPLFVRARTLSSTNWSAVSEAAFQIGESRSPLQITEIMYHPPGGEHYEYIELENTSPLSLDLSGIHFEGIEFRFPAGTVVPGGARLVLIPDANPTAFALRYPNVTVFGRYGGSLSNGGERLALIDGANRTTVSVDYQDADGWPRAADGSGASLEIINPRGDPNDPANWRASAYPGGSPGAANPQPAPPQVRINEIAAAPPVATAPGSPTNDWCELHNAGPTDADLTGWSLSNGRATQRLVFPPLTLSAGDYLLILCDAESQPVGLHAGFTLDQSGDRLFLANAAGEQVDALGFGPQAAGFTLGRVGEDSTWQLTMPTPDAPNTAASMASPARLVLNEFLANSTPGANDWIELYNRDPQLPVALHGLSLAITNAQFQITSLGFVGPGAHVVLYADDQPGPDHLCFRLPAAGSYIALYDTNRLLLDRVSYTNAQEGVSLGRLPDGHTNMVAFSLSPSPGTANYLPNDRGALLHEVLARNLTHHAPASGRVADWIELCNPTSNTVALSGMSLSVNERRPGQWIVPADVSLHAGECLTVWCDSTRPASLTNEPDLCSGQALSDSGGGVYLFDTEGRLVDGVLYGFQLPDQSFGRVHRNWTLLTQPTPGSADAAPADLGDPANVRLNEWLADGDAHDWIELYNLDTRPVLLTGMILTDDPSLAGQTNGVIGPLTFIDARGWVLCLADGEVTRGPDHLPFRLDALGETIRLYSVGRTLVDNVDLLVQLPGVAEGRYPDGNTNLAHFPYTASPGLANRLATEPDGDHDSLSDAWELAHGLNPRSPAGNDGPDGDPDNDGLPNRIERDHGSNPLAQDLVVTGIAVAPEGLRLAFNTIVGQTYAIEQRDDFEHADWRLLTHLLPAPASGIAEMEFPLPQDAPTRYYRVRLQ